MDATNHPALLDNIEIFEIAAFGEDHHSEPPYDRLGGGPGWYWWHRMPGALPSTEAVGPFFSEAEAVIDAPPHTRTVNL